jgi:hypothetical protein
MDRSAPPLRLLQAYNRIKDKRVAAAVLALVEALGSRR